MEAEAGGLLWRILGKSGLYNNFQVTQGYTVMPNPRKKNTDKKYWLWMQMLEVICQFEFSEFLEYIKVICVFRFRNVSEVAQSKNT